MYLQQLGGQGEQLTRPCGYKLYLLARNIVRMESSTDYSYVKQIYSHGSVLFHPTFSSTLQQNTPYTARLQSYW